jgi:hypothetical protein
MWRRIGRAVYQGFAPRAGFPGQAFHLGFRPFLASQTVTGVIPLLLFAIHGPEHLRFYALAFLLFKISIGALLSAWIITRYFPVLLDESGVRARNLWGTACFLEWSDIEAAHPIRWLLFTRYIRLLSSKSRLAIWIPLFLDNQSEFNAKVRKWAPAGNPLREKLEK